MWNDAITDPGASALLLHAAAYAAMLVIPGPSFMIVSQASLSASRREAALVAAGVASGACLLTVILMRGATNLPASHVWAEVGRLAGALVLLVVGCRALARALRPAPHARAAAGRAGGGRPFTVGLVTALTNPISFSFFSSVALASRADDRGLDGALLPGGVFVMALAWFGLLAMLLSKPAVQSLYGRAARRLDAIMGAILVTVALRWLLQGG